MNLSVYSVSHLQNMEQMLNHFEAEGLTDSRFIRQRIHDFLQEEVLKQRKSYLVATPPGKRRINRGRQAAGNEVTMQPRVCPDCGRPLSPVVNYDGLNIIGCKDCRYSRIEEIG